jgi:hypothetical protein
MYAVKYYSAIKMNKIISFEENGGIGEHNIEQNTPSSKSQILHVLSHMWNLGLK